MRPRHLARRIFLAPVAGLALALTIAGCSSSSSSSPGTSKPSATPSSSSTISSSAAANEIKANWEAFFSGSTSATKKISLLQNGQALASVVKGQAKSSLATGASAKVSSVTVTSPTKATVKYTVYLNGSPALPNATGVAIYQDGTWKVGLASFCGLLKLETVTAPGCSSAG